MVDFGPAEPRIARELVEFYAVVIRYLTSGGTTMLYYNPEGLDCHWSWLWQHNLSHHPQIAWQQKDIHPHIAHLFNSDLFVLACLSSGSGGESSLKALTTTLEHRIAVRILIEVVGSSLDVVARRMLTFCFGKHLLNVELYFRNWNGSFGLFSYQAFPYFELIRRNISQSLDLQLFVDKMRDLRGHRLRILPDLSPPNSFEYRDEKGKMQMAGYLWDFIASFAGQIGAGVEVMHPPWLKESTAPDSFYMLEFTGNGTVDVGLTTTLITKRIVWAYYQYSYPVLYSSWCIMLPVERPMPTVDLFGRVLSVGTAVILILMTILFCWLVGYASDRWRLVRLMPRLMALLVVSSCTAQLQSLLISPPYQKRICSFDDLLESDLKILGLTGEFYSLNGAFRARYATAFHLIRDPDELYEQRNHFNISYAYTVARIKWEVVNNQQRHFARPLFRFSEDLCLVEYMPTSIILAPSSIYWEPLKDFGLMVNQAGLFSHWIRKSFYDMVRTGWMTIKDYSVPEELVPLGMGDLELAWRICGWALMVSIAAFLLELIYFYSNLLLNIL
ncbi:hypothetical protein KR009_009034 [Drosophila setifemur]|nr:hypothetical protein KR009_009034 [Drosophila setifemur]